MAFGISHAQVVADLIQSGAIADSVKEFVAAQLEGKADDATIQHTADVLTAELNLTLLQVASFELGAALQSPGLTQQIFGNVPSLSITQTPPTLTETVQDPIKQLFLKSTLSTALSKETHIPGFKANEILNDIVNALLANPEISTETLKSSLVEGLVNRGIDLETANRLADLAEEIVNKENSRFIGLSSDLLNQEIAEDLLANALVKSDIKDSQRISAETILQVLRSGNFANDQEFAIQVQLQLQAAGISQDRAVSASESLIASVKSTTPLPPLQNPAPEILPPEELKEQIYARIYGLLKDSLGEERARTIALQGVATVVGGIPSTGEIVDQDIQSPNSLINLTNDQVKVLLKESAGTASVKIADSFRYFMGDSIDLIVLHKKISDPAYTFAISMYTGLMYNGEPQPKNFTKSIDFVV